MAIIKISNGTKTASLKLIEDEARIATNEYVRAKSQILTRK